FSRGVPRGAARPLRADRPARTRLVRGGGVVPRPAARAGTHAGGATVRRAACAPASLPARLPHARRSATPGPLARPIRAPPRLHLLLRPGPGRRQLRRGARAGHERAGLALHLVRAALERRPRAHAARRHRADAGHLRDGRHRYPCERAPPPLRGGRRARQALRRAARRGPLPEPRGPGRRAARRPAPAGRGRAHRTVAPRALEDLTSDDLRGALLRRPKASRMRTSTGSTSTAITSTTS